MARSKLLKEAIADAKAVRETALANAKLALEEAFTPHLSSMLAARLREEDDLEGDEFMDDDELDLGEGDLPSAADGHGADEGGETDIDAVEKSSFTEAAVDVGDGVKNDSDLDSSNVGNIPADHTMQGAPGPKNPDELDSSDIDNEGKLGMNEQDEFDIEDDEDELDLDMEQDMDMELGDEEEEEEGDLDLEAVIRELEADIDGEEDEFADDDELDLGEADDELDLDIEDDEDELDLGEAGLPSAADGHGSDEGGETDDAAITKSTFTQGEKQQTGPISEQDFEIDDDDEELDLEEILREIEDEEEEELAVAENRQLKKELKEYRTAVKFLRSKLQEVNLLNAKLLYTNRLFRDYNMNIRDKMRVVETFDRATTSREAKLVYATLAESFRGGGSKTPRKRRITEGLASRSGGSTRPRSTKTTTIDETDYAPTILREGADQVSRLQKLAGIKNK